MPNHVYTQMNVSGTEEQITNFAEKHFVEGQFSLQSFIPMPEELENTTSPPTKRNPKLIKKFGADNWYDWKNNNWGTKWDTYDGDMDTPASEELTCNFQTAWNLPEPIFVIMAKLYPTMTFLIETVEEGGAFGGTIDIVNGEIIEDLSPEKWKEYATELLGWVDDEEENLRLLAMETIDGLMQSHPQQPTDNTMRQAMARYIKNNMDDFMETIL